MITDELWTIIIKCYLNSEFDLTEYPNYKIEKSGSTYIITKNEKL